MANRVIRDWTASENVDNLSIDAEVFFTRLIMKADDYGNYISNLKLIKAALYPLRDVSTEQIDFWLCECVTNGLIKRYEVEGKKFLHIPNFDQNLRRMKNTYPPPPAGYFLEHDDGQARTSADKRGQITAETKGKESETESETEREGTPALGLKKSFDWWWVQLDEIWLDNLKATHNGKDIQGAAREAHLSLMSNELRLRNTDLSGFKGYVNSWLSNKQKDGNRTGIKGSTSKARTGFSGTGYSEKL